MPTAYATSVSIADAVVQELRTITLTRNPVYSSTYNTDRQLKDNGILHIDVISAGHEITPIARDVTCRDQVIQIVVRKRLNNSDRKDDDAEIDRLCKLAEEIEDHFDLGWLDEADAACLKCEPLERYDDDYREWRQFTAIIAITFRKYGD